MLLFFQQLGLQLFLWLLQLIDGIMELFNAISGVATVSYQGQKVNILELIIGDTVVANIFWCIFVLAVGLTCIFAIVGIIKNILANNRNLSSIVGKFFLALLGTMAMLAVVFLGIMIAGAGLSLIAQIFQIGNTMKISNAIFNACVGDWINGYSINGIDVTSLSVSDIFGTFNSALFGIWPTSWKMNGMVNPDTFYYMPALIAGCGVTIALMIALINLAKRIFEVVYLYFCMPISMSTLPLDDGARFKNWREQFVTKIILAYGAVFSVNVFAIILPIILQVHIDSLNGFGNAMFMIIMIIGGAMVIPAGQTLFARLFGQADDYHAGGSFLRSAFYGSRIIGGMTIGLAAKGAKGIYHVAQRSRAHHAASAEKKGDGESKEASGEDEKFTEAEGAGAESAESTEGGSGE